MRESRSELMDRLRLEGRWDAFCRAREELKQRGTAATDAWRIAAADFPPLQSAAPVDARPDLSPLRGKPPVSLMHAARWVFENIDLEVEPADAPSLGAWSMRNWARSSHAARGEFYSVFASKLLNHARIEDERLERAAQDNQTQQERIEYVLAALASMQSPEK